MSKWFFCKGSSQLKHVILAIQTIMRVFSLKCICWSMQKTVWCYTEGKAICILLQGIHNIKHLRVTQNTLQLLFFFFFSFSSVLLERLPKIFFINILWFITQKACDQDQIYSLDISKKVFVTNVFKGVICDVCDPCHPMHLTFFMLINIHSIQN